MQAILKIPRRYKRENSTFCRRGLDPDTPENRRYSA